MDRSQNPNLELLTLAVEQLGALTDELVFVGGCATGLLITDAAAPPIRITRDVDAIIQVATLASYHQFSDKLRAQGFAEDIESGAPLCRWRTEFLILDVMPTDERILGFGNQWYAEAARNAEDFRLPSGRHIKIVSAPYFLITKLEAFEGRGDGDFLMSHDIEDVIAVLDGRPELLEELTKAPPELVYELAERFNRLADDKAFFSSIAGHMPADPASQKRVPAIMGLIHRIACLGGETR